MRCGCWKSAAPLNLCHFFLNAPRTKSAKDKEAQRTQRVKRVSSKAPLEAVSDPPPAEMQSKNRVNSLKYYEMEFSG